MNISERTLKKYLLGVLPFAALWYFFFASSFVLRVYPSLFWAAFMCLGLLIAIATRYRMTDTDTGFLLSVFGLVLISALAGAPTTGLNYSMYFAIYYIVAIFVAKAFDVSLVQKQIYFFCLVHLLCVFIQVVARDFYVATILPLLPEYVHANIIGQMDYNSSYYGFTVQTSMTALYLSIGALLSCLYAKYTRKSIAQKVYVVIAALFVIGLFFTTRRGSTAAVLLVMGLVFWQSGGNKANKILLALCSAVILGLIGLDNLPGLSGLLEKTQRLVEDGQFMNGRDQIWGAAIQAFLERPLFGYGAENAGSASGFNSVDNAYVAVLVERGIVGALIFFLPYVVLWSEQRQMSRIWRPKTIVQDFSYYIQVLYFVMSFVENYFGEPLTMFVYLVVVNQAQGKYYNRIGT